VSWVGLTTGYKGQHSGHGNNQRKLGNYSHVSFGGAVIFVLFNASLSCVQTSF
jgi:hypothetical protein